MGLGKTVIMLTAIAELLAQAEIGKVLIIAPLKVAETVWEEEAKKWSHLQWLTFSKVLGPEAKRKAAIKAKAHIYIINRENVVWLADLGFLPFDAVVVDELSSFRNPASRRFKALARATANTPRLYGLTGTPTPKGCENLWAQIFLLDRGKRLGRTVTQFRREWCAPGLLISGVVTKYEVTPGRVPALLSAIKDITLSVSSAGVVDLPEVTYNNIEVPLGPAVLKKYKEFEKEKILELSEDKAVTALNAAALVGKLLQFSNGAVYTDDAGEYEEIHTAKLQALEDIIEVNEGKPILVAYAFKSDKERLLRYLRANKPVALSCSEDVEKWNKGEIPVLLAHPASAGHGLNLQYGGSIVVWFGLTYDLELYEQFNKRLHRSGQRNNVIIHHLLGAGTRDAQVLQVLQKKATLQDVVMSALSEK